MGKKAPSAPSVVRRACPGDRNAGADQDDIGALGLCRHEAALRYGLSVHWL